MVINNHAFSDPYIFSQEVKDGKKNNLFYNYPLSYFDKNREEDKEYFDYLTNHFDYLWNLDITMLCRDATYYDLQTHPQGLMDIRTPDKVIWNQKRARIESYLKDLKEKNKRKGLPGSRNKNAIDDRPRQRSVGVKPRRISGSVKPKPFSETLYEERRPKRSRG